MCAPGDVVFFEFVDDLCPFWFCGFGFGVLGFGFGFGFGDCGGSCVRGCACDRCMWCRGVLLDFFLLGPLVYLHLTRVHYMVTYGTLSGTARMPVLYSLLFIREYFVTFQAGPFHYIR